MKFAFHTLGCKVNRFESQALSQLAQSRGHEIVTQDADVCIINTCTVTSVSDHKNIRAFHKLRRENPHAIIAACGCFAQTDPEKVLAQPEIDLVCGTADRASILERCERMVRGEADDAVCAACSVPSTVFESLPAGVPAGRTRALLKIQDGCDNYCTYCIIPYARGHVRSMDPKEVLSQVRQLVNAGIHEIVLTGIEISSYGSDLESDTNLVSLIEQVCREAPHVRIRLSSLEPRTVDDAFCRRLSVLPNLMHHFHLSLQSGSDSVLIRMKRKYTTQEYLQIITRLRMFFPHCSLTTDLIIGFPGETEQEFCETLAFIRQCNFSDMHVFPYSPRSGTIAAAMSGQIAPPVKEDRADQVKALARTMRKKFLDTFIGNVLEVLLEHPVGEGMWSGHAAYDFPVLIHTQGVKNTLVTVRIVGRNAAGLIGEEIPIAAK